MSQVRHFSFPGAPVNPLAKGGVRYPECAITLRASGAMKPGKDDENRMRVFRSLGIAGDRVMSVTQIHSRIVHIAASSRAFTGCPEGDGVLTVHPDLVPCVTVADCMPLWLFDPVTGFFGVLHSGWKGTGILRTALDLAREEWGAQSDTIRLILGPHIRSCCYTVDEERAQWFRRTVGPSCVSLDPQRQSEGSKWPWRLSLAEANRSLALSLGIQEEHLLDTGVCTSCDHSFGSSRREGASCFTHMAAYIRMS